MVQIRSFPYETDTNSMNLLRGKDSTPLRSLNVRYDDICALLGCLSISTGQAELGPVEVLTGGRLDSQMDLDSMIPPRNTIVKIEPPSDNASGTSSSVEWYRHLLATTRNEIQTILKRMRELEASGEAIQYPNLLGQIQNSQDRAALSERLALLTHHQDALTEALYIEETMLYYGD